MAGLGYKIFATDDILTAVDLNGYLADQVVMVFASAAARTSGITYPAEGMITYLSDSNSLWHYDGSAWVGIPTAAGGTASYASSAGTALTSGTASYSTTSGTAVYAPDSATAQNAIRVAGSKVFVQSSTPTAEEAGDLWFW